MLRSDADARDHGLPFTTIFREILSESKWNTTYWKRKIAGSNRISEKVVLFFRMEYSKQFQAFAVVFRSKWNWFVQMANSIPGRNYQSWTLRTIYPHHEPTGLPM